MRRRKRRRSAPKCGVSTERIVVCMIELSSFLMCKGALIHAWMHARAHTHNQFWFCEWVGGWPGLAWQAISMGLSLLFSLLYSSVFLPFLSFSVFFFHSVPHALSPAAFIQQPQAIKHTNAPTPNIFSEFAQNTPHGVIYLSLSIFFTLSRLIVGSHTHKCERARTHMHTFSKLDSIKFVFIRSLQTGLNLYRRNNIPACCVKLYELMKSAG